MHLTGRVGQRALVHVRALGHRERKRSCRPTRVATKPTERRPGGQGCLPDPVRRTPQAMRTNRRPEKEGIKTGLPLRCYGAAGTNRRPEKEGIKTATSFRASTKARPTEDLKKKGLRRITVLASVIQD